MSFVRLTYHIVFAVRYRKHEIVSEHARDCYAVMVDLLRKDGVYVWRIGGMPDHIHLLVDIPPTIDVSTALQNLKRASSHAFRGMLPLWSGWQEGYSAFSVSHKDIPTVKAYIMNQKEHHRTVPFLEEYRAWLIENGVSPSEPYFPR